MRTRATRWPTGPWGVVLTYVPLVVVIVIAFRGSTVLGWGTPAAVVGIVAVSVLLTLARWHRTGLARWAPARYRPRRPVTRPSEPCPGCGRRTLRGCVCGDCLASGDAERLFHCVACGTWWAEAGIPLPAIAARVKKQWGNRLLWVASDRTHGYVAARLRAGHRLHYDATGRLTDDPAPHLRDVDGLVVTRAVHGPQDGGGRQG